MTRTPFKMKGFSGFGNSPLKQEKQPVGPVETDPMSRFFSKTPPKGTIVPIGEGVVSEEGGGSGVVVEKKKKDGKKKKKKRGWLGLPDIGVTEFLDKYTK